nr:hypothetical protein [Tanacetum cinerariifolium]
IGETDDYNFKLDKKKCRADTKVFCEILQICPRLPNQDFVELPSKEDLLTLIKELGYSASVTCYLPFELIKSTSLEGRLPLPLTSVSLGKQQDLTGSGNHELKSYDSDDDDGINDDDGNDDDSGNDDGVGNDAQDSERTDSDDDENPSFTLKDFREEEQDKEYAHTLKKDKFDDEEKMYE